MSDNVIQLFHTKETTLEFKVDIQGLNVQNVKCYFVIETGQMNVSFICENGGDGKWNVKVPPLTMLEKTAYNFHICVICDEYYFEPLRGIVNITATPEIFVQMPQSTLASTIPSPTPIASTTAVDPASTDGSVTVSFGENGSVKKRRSAMTIKELADEVVKLGKIPLLKENIKEGNKVITENKDDIVKKILKEVSSEKEVKNNSNLPFKKGKIVTI